AQTRENPRFDKDGVFIEPIRGKGRTTNQLFNSSSPFTQTLVANQDPPIPIADTWDWSNTKHTADTNLQYVFFSDLDFSRANPIGRLSLAIDGGTDLNNRLSLASNVLDPNGNPQFNQQSPFILLDFDQLPDPNKVFKKD